LSAPNKRGIVLRQRLRDGGSEVFRGVRHMPNKYVCLRPLICDATLPRSSQGLTLTGLSGLSVVSDGPSSRGRGELRGGWVQMERQKKASHPDVEGG
ncbi:hypothetical protein KUCAC02_010318, partial [Chaenocephalus aceratus]